MKFKSVLSTTALVAILSQALSPVMAEENRKRNYPNIYPFVPVPAEHIHKRIRTLSEDPEYLGNLWHIDQKGLSSGRTKSQPWTSTYWPLNKGILADPYTESISLNPFRAQREISWQANWKRLNKRRKDVHAKWRSLDQEELDHLSPSEKYDILLGDETFHLTNKLRNYMFKWGSKKEYGSLSALHLVGGKALDFAKELVADPNNEFDSMRVALPYAIKNRGGLADKFAAYWVRQGHYNSFEEALPAAIQRAVDESKNYVLKKKTVLMALWEGICQGWSTAAGHLPRPERTVSFRLPNGKTLKFFPSDIKGLASLMWAYSLIQDILIADDTGGKTPDVNAGVFMEGLRCNDKNAETDEWGRYYDARPDAFSKKLEPRCVGVHPAIWHLALVNIIGKQGRSFVVERKVTHEVDNHPMARYRSQYFDPYEGEYGSLRQSVRRITNKDIFRKFRSPEAKYIIGVKTTMTYTDWKRPDREPYDHPGKDDMKDIEMLYDLELDDQWRIVGGQWRADEDGKPTWLFDPANRNQPDFFWVITKNWKKFFKTTNEDPTKPFKISEWTDKTKLPPSDWKQAAFLEHNFVYHETHEYGWNQKCEVKNEKTDQVYEVACEFKYNKPRPLIDVVKTLLELSSGKSW